ncbi:Norsolorinic acid reductase [Neofusicoccum parvum]|uniref:Norsolorinic acid reductase n=1 Tax=Neofusicoccum parvum TaxID=310453 RepID=A0ACB5SGK4_9PEZI|nr:Norsolorinic acid reductase [Neofusicoccum parvum]GME43377.1 Norsolorinic acid reductase [Neofusicoccum parvum]
MAFPIPPEPKSALGWHRLLSPTAGVRVSPLCLGAMNFGNAWEGFMGKCDKTTTYEILDYFFEQGGNFIDTANNYQGEESEEWLGDWMKERNNRDQIVLATKFTTCYPSGKGGEKIKGNYQGNHAKSLKHSVAASLKKLQTDYIDLLYLHWWDFSTSIPEVMQSLHHLVQAGKVIYLGVSDTPAWVVSKANQYARDHALTQFSVYQGRWSAADRDFERDIMHMAYDEGMALAPWGALGGGMFKTEEQYAKSEGRNMRPQSENAKKITAALDKISKAKGTLITSIALAYVMHKAPYVFPIVGGRKVEHLKGNIEALSIQLSPEEIKEIEDAVPFDVGFPSSMLFEFFGMNKYQSDMSTFDIPLVKSAGYLDTVQKVQPIKPRKV